MGPVPDTLIKSADWQLVCNDDNKLPCHSLLLSAVSKVFESLQDTTKEPQSGILVDVPFQGSSELAKHFLEWVYKRTTSQFSTTALAIQMAELGH